MSVKDKRRAAVDTALSGQGSEANARLFSDASFITGVLEGSMDCVKVLSLDGTLEFMSRGGQRVMEVRDLNAVVGCSWPTFWPGDGQQKARDAIDQARSGRTITFEGEAPTAQGTPRYWEVTVSPILGEDGMPSRLLSISRDVTARKKLELEREIVSQELYHRVLNTLAMVTAITTQSFRAADNLKSAESAISGRLQALSKAQTLLLRSDFENIDVNDIVRSAIEAYDSHPSRFAVQGTPFKTSARGGLFMALALNELCTNATKYGSLSSDAGRVDISWIVAPSSNGFALWWTEKNGPPVVPPTRNSFGMRLLQNGIAAQLGGRTTLEFDPAGLCCVLEMPLGGITAA